MVNMSIDAQRRDSVAHQDSDNFEVERAVERARQWSQRAHDVKGGVGSRLMNHMLGQPGGLSFLTSLMDGMFRPEDPRVVADTLRAAGHEVPATVAWPLRAGIKLGGLCARSAPRPTAHLGRGVVRSLVGHLVVDARDDKLAKSLQRLKADGSRINLNLLGEAVLGSEEARKRVARTAELIAHPDVDYVSIKVSAAVGPHSPWAVEETIPEVIDALRPLYRKARDNGGVFVNLDMEEYHDLEMTEAVFTRLLSEPEFHDLSAGIVLQAYLPEARSALARLQAFAVARVAAGGAPLKVRLVKGANLSMEHVQAEIRGWEAAPWHSKPETDAHYKRVIDDALDPSTIDALRVGIAGHNLFDIALASLRAHERGVEHGVDYEMLLGMAPGQMAAVSEDLGPIRLYTPAVDPRDFDVALAYLARRLEEVASEGNYVADAARFGQSDEALSRQERAFREAYELSLVSPERLRGRTPAMPRVHSLEAFVNTPDTDPAVVEDREDLRHAAAAAETSDLGVATVEARTVRSKQELDEVLASAHAAGVAWGAVPATRRADALMAIADALETARPQLVEVMAAEAGKTVDQSDPEVSEAIDFARFYAKSAANLDHHHGARAVPRALTLVTPPWNFPVAIPAGSTLASLAAGSAVVMKPSSEAVRCAAVLTDVMRDALMHADLNPDIVRCAPMSSREFGRDLLTDSRIDQVVLTGGYETAERFLEFRPDLDVRAETSGKNVMIVTPHADLDLAAADVVQSAFGHAGQKCSAASLVILVGSVAQSERLKTQIIDAVSTLRVGRPWDLTTQMGPVIKEPTDKLLRALTTLDEGEQWWVEPERLGDALWTPGVKAPVARGSWFHKTECFGPVLGVMHAESLDDAIALVNEIDYGLTSGLHSLDESEIRTWIDGVEAGNLYVNRGMTGAIVQRQPFGGWKRSVVGPTVKAGGVHYVPSLTDWERNDDASGAVTTDRSPSATVVARADAAAWVRTAVDRDGEAWDSRFGRGLDPTGMNSEFNVARYRPHHTPIYWDGANWDDVVRVVAASVRATGHAEVWTPDAANADRLRDVVRAGGGDVEVLAGAHLAGKARAVGRVRVVGDRPAVLNGDADVAVFGGPVTGAPDLELIPFLREQAVSMSAHRYGTPFAPAHHVRDTLMATGRAVN